MSIERDVQQESGETHRVVTDENHELSQQVNPGSA